MIYQGTFNDYNNTYKYRVTINAGGGMTHNIIDPTETRTTDDEVYFSPDPVHITCDRSDLTQLIMIAQCQIKLKVNQDLSNILFANTNRDISITVEREILQGVNRTYRKLFYGYVDPLQFNQPFAHKYEEITINATDPLGALEQLTINNVDTSESEVLPFMNLIVKILDKVMNEDVSFNGINAYLANNIHPNMIKVNTSVFYGDDNEDGMTLYDVMNELLKYLGCTICYEPNGRTVNLFNIYNGTPNNLTPPRWFDAAEDAMDTSSSLSKDDAYSKVTLTCEIEPVDDDIKLLDSDYMYSDYTNYQKYMTELVSTGEGWDAYGGFGDLLGLREVPEETTNYDGGYKLDHFCYVKRNNAWEFGSSSYINVMNGTESKEATDEARKMKGDQSDVLRWLKNHTGKAAFVSFGKGNKINYKDNSLTNNISMTDYLVIAINGHNDHGKNGHIKAMMANMIINSPICKYNGLKALNLTPTDPKITNYVVISGKIILNPLQRKTGPTWQADPNFPEEWHDGPGGMEMLFNNSTNTLSQTKQVWGQLLGIKPYLWHKTVPHPDNGDGAYYQQKWWKCSNPRNPEYNVTDEVGIYGFLDNKENEMLKYSWTSYGNEEDKISKLPILSCQLKVGDKYCIELLNNGIEGQGVFKWVTYEEWATTYNKQGGADVPYFTIGIDPKVDDKLVGSSYSIQNNIEYTMNIDGTGTSIPITSDDKLNGAPEFTILGVMNQMWNEIERVHPTLFRSTSWNDHYFWLLELLDSIMISDLKIEFKSDNALINEDASTADNDLVYYSDTNPLYKDKLECDLKICTPLTMEECQQWGIKYKMSNSYIMTTNDEPFYGWTIGNETVKPEQLFIDYYYKQYLKPARKISFNVDNGDVFGTQTTDETSYIGFSTILSQYVINMEYPGIVNVMGEKVPYNYYCMSMDWSIKYRSNNMTVREVLDYDNPFSE